MGRALCGSFLRRGLARPAPHPGTRGLRPLPSPERLLRATDWRVWSHPRACALALGLRCRRAVRGEGPWALRGEARVSRPALALTGGAQEGRCPSLVACGGGAHGGQWDLCSTRSLGTVTRPKRPKSAIVVLRGVGCQSVSCTSHVRRRVKASGAWRRARRLPPAPRPRAVGTGHLLGTPAGQVAAGGHTSGGMCGKKEGRPFLRPLRVWGQMGREVGTRAPCSHEAEASL